VVLPSAQIKVYGGIPFSTVRFTFAVHAPQGVGLLTQYVKESADALNEIHERVKMKINCFIIPEYI